MSDAKESRLGTVMTTLALVVICLLVLAPIIWAGMAATKPLQVAFANPPRLSYDPTVDAFVRLWRETNFATYLLNTLIVAAASVVVTLLIAAPAAYALARVDARIAAAVLGAALLLRASPAFATVLPFYNFAVDLHIYDTRVALTIAFVAIDQPFTIWLLRGFFLNIPSELDEAAMVDGCTRWQAFRIIVLPVATPGLVTAAILTFMLAFQEYILPVVLTDVSAKTVPVFLASQLGQTLPLLQQAAAGVMLISLPIVVAAFVVQRYLIAGLTSGSVKG